MKIADLFPDLKAFLKKHKKVKSIDNTIAVRKAQRMRPAKQAGFGDVGGQTGGGPCC